MKNIYVTGATGFIGKHLIENLSISNFNIIATVRKKNDTLPPEIRQDVIGDIIKEENWEEKLKGVDTIIHLAAQSSFNKASHSIELLREINVLTTEKLALAAVKAGVKRFIFLSTVKVNGEGSSKPYTELDEPQPEDDYGRSKLEAEKRLIKISKETGLEIVILRPTLVYGEGVQGNFKTLIKLVNKGVPLPFGNIKNKRSLCSVYNLADFIRVCITHKGAANETFLVADGKSLSTSELLTQIAHAKGKPLFLLPLPVSFMKRLLGLIGKKAIAKRLYGDLEVELSKARKILGWETRPLQIHKIIGS